MSSHKHKVFCELSTHVAMCVQLLKLLFLSSCMIKSCINTGKLCVCLVCLSCCIIKITQVSYVSAYCPWAAAQSNYTGKLCLLTVHEQLHHQIIQVSCVSAYCSWAPASSNYAGKLCVSLSAYCSVFMSSCIIKLNTIHVSCVSAYPHVGNDKGEKGDSLPCSRWHLQHTMTLKTTQ